MAADSDCAICLERVDEAAKALRCTHRFHTVCIDRWLAIKNSCPTCRIAVTERASGGTTIPEFLAWDVGYPDEYDSFEEDIYEENLSEDDTNEDNLSQEGSNEDNLSQEDIYGENVSQEDIYENILSVGDPWEENLSQDNIYEEDPCEENPYEQDIYEEGPHEEDPNEQNLPEELDSDLSIEMDASEDEHASASGDELDQNSYTEEGDAFSPTLDFDDDNEWISEGEVLYGNDADDDYFADPYYYVSEWDEY